MKKATDKAVEALAAMSQKVAGKNHIAKVAAISAGDVTVGNLPSCRRKPTRYTVAQSSSMSGAVRQLSPSQ